LFPRAIHVRKPEDPNAPRVIQAVEDLREIAKDQKALDPMSRRPG
jgi:hypothetical protein